MPWIPQIWCLRPILQYVHSVWDTRWRGLHLFHLLTSLFTSSRTLTWNDSSLAKNQRKWREMPPKSALLMPSNKNICFSVWGKNSHTWQLISKDISVPLKRGRKAVLYSFHRECFLAPSGRSTNYMSNTLWKHFWSRTQVEGGLNCTVK